MNQRCYLCWRPAHSFGTCPEWIGLINRFKRAYLLERKKWRALRMEKQKKAKNSQIVKLRQLIKKWSSASNSPCGYLCLYTINPSYPPPDVPRGCLPVHVGREERKRFIIPTTYLSTPQIIPLLDKAGEEFGYNHIGLLTLPCEITVFEQLLLQLKGSKL